MQVPTRDVAGRLVYYAGGRVTLEVLGTGHHPTLLYWDHGDRGRGRRRPANGQLGLLKMSDKKVLLIERLIAPESGLSSSPTTPPLSLQKRDHDFELQHPLHYVVSRRKLPFRCRAARTHRRIDCDVERQACTSLLWRSSIRSPTTWPISLSGSENDSAMLSLWHESESRPLYRWDFDLPAGIFPLSWRLKRPRW